METDESAELAALIRRLDADTVDEAEEAKFEAISRGQAVIGPLVEALPSLSTYAQLSAIEIFEEVPDERAHPALIELLTSESSTVREWAAVELGYRRVQAAAPALWDAYNACLRRGDALEYSEPTGIRNALTRVGARTPVMPALTARLQVSGGFFDNEWPSSQLSTVVNDLAAHDQVVLYFMLWKVVGEKRYHESRESLFWHADWSKPWPEIVEAAREAALIDAIEAPDTDQVVATIEWVAEADLNIM